MPDAQASGSLHRPDVSRRPRCRTRCVGHRSLNDGEETADAVRVSIQLTTASCYE